MARPQTRHGGGPPDLLRSWRALGDDFRTLVASMTQVELPLNSAGSMIPNHLPQSEQWRCLKYPIHATAAQTQNNANCRTGSPAKTECKTKGMGISVKEIATTKETVRRGRRAK